MKARSRHTATAAAAAAAATTRHDDLDDDLEDNRKKGKATDGWVDEDAVGTGRRRGRGPSSASGSGAALSFARVCCKRLAFVTCLFVVVFVVGAVGMFLEIQASVSNHATARSNPVNTYIAEHILPRKNQMAGFWSAGELEAIDGLNKLRLELTRDGLWKVIRDEYLEWRKRHEHDMARHACFEFKWQRTAYMRFYGQDVAPMHAEFPKTSEILGRSPFTSAGFYSMQPTSKLNAHRGVHSGILRYHLGLVIPDEGSRFVLCNMKPGIHRPDELRRDTNDCRSGHRFHEYHIEEGADWVFDDTDIHYATTSSESDQGRAGGAGVPRQV